MNKMYKTLKREPNKKRKQQHASKIKIIKNMNKMYKILKSKKRITKQ